MRFLVGTGEQDRRAVAACSDRMRQQKARIMRFIFRPMDLASAQSLVGWHYDAPYDIYDMGTDAGEETIEFLIDP